MSQELWSKSAFYYLDIDLKYVNVNPFLSSISVIYDTLFASTVKGSPTRFLFCLWGLWTIFRVRSRLVYFLKTVDIKFSIGPQQKPPNIGTRSCVSEDDSHLQKNSSGLFKIMATQLAFCVLWVFGAKLGPTSKSPSANLRKMFTGSWPGRGCLLLISEFNVVSREKLT